MNSEYLIEKLKECIDPLENLLSVLDHRFKFLNRKNSPPRPSDLERQKRIIDLLAEIKEILK